MRWWPRGALWRRSDFLRLWAAQIVSAVGSRITRTALPVIAILTIEATPEQLALLGSLSIAPGILVGLLGGGFIDRSAKRSILIAADVIRAVLIMTVPVAAWLGQLGMGQLYLIAGLVGAASALFEITDNTYLPVLVAADELPAANSALEASESFAEITGPGLAGLLIQVFGGPIAMVIDALTYLWSALFLAAIRTPEVIPEAPPGRPSLAADIATGFRAVLGHALLRPLFLSGAVSTLSWGFFLTLYMLFTLDTLALSPGTVGLIISCGGIGALFGAVLSTRLTPRLGLGPAMIVFVLLSQAGQLLIPLASGSHWLDITALVGHQLIGDGFMVAFMIQAISLRQTVLPHNLLGRVNGTFQVMTGASFLIGTMIAGPLAGAIGVRPAVWVGVLAGLGAPLVLLLSPIRRLQAMPAPAAPATPANGAPTDGAPAHDAPADGPTAASGDGRERMPSILEDGDEAGQDVVQD